MKKTLRVIIGITNICVGIVNILNKCSVDIVNTKNDPMLFIMMITINIKFIGIDIERISWLPELNISKYPAIKNSTDLYKLCLITCMWDISSYMLLAYTIIIDIFIIVEYAINFLISSQHHI